MRAAWSTWRALHGAPPATPACRRLHSNSAHTECTAQSFEFRPVNCFYYACSRTVLKHLLMKDHYSGMLLPVGPREVALSVSKQRNPT